MLIRKLFKFEGAHIVRNCLTDRCKSSMHGHSYKVEFLLFATGLDKGQMVIDFSEVKKMFGSIVDAFDHTLLLWDKDDPEYLAFMKQFSQRWIMLPVSPSAEQLARVFFYLAQQRLALHPFKNGEHDTLCIDSVIVHETDTGYAQAYVDDVNEFTNGVLSPVGFTFSLAVGKVL